MQLETTLHPVSRHGSSGERRRTWLRWSASASAALGAALAGCGQTEASTDAVACTEVRRFRIPRALFGQLAQDRDELPRGLMPRLQRALDAAEAWVSDLSTRPARRRLPHLLWRLAEHAGTDATIWLPRREEIGAMLDLMIETASRLVRALRREGVLALLPRRSAALDCGALRKALQSEGAA